MLDSARQCCAPAIAGLALCLAAGAAAAQVVAVVSARSPVAALSHDQLAEIFLGKASRYPDGSQALPVDQAEGAAPRDEFYLRFAGKSAAQVKAHWSKIIFTGRGQPPRELAGGDEVKKFVSENAHAIGYIDRSQVDARVKVLPAQ